jgi:hypothetical protein
MNARQQIVTAVMALLMLGTLLVMPGQPSPQGPPATKRAGWVTTPVQNRAELPAEQVRDLAYN